VICTILRQILESKICTQPGIKTQFPSPQPVVTAMSYRDGPWPDLSLLLTAVNNRPTRLQPKYFPTWPEEFFFDSKGKKLKNLTFLVDTFQIQTQTINGWPNPTRATKNWPDPTQVKNFWPEPITNELQRPFMYFKPRPSYPLNRNNQREQVKQLQKQKRGTWFHHILLTVWKINESFLHFSLQHF